MSSAVRRRLTWPFALAAALAPAAALACPACGKGDVGMGTLYALGAMILFPFSVAAVVYGVVRKLETDPAEPLPLPRTPESAP